MHQFAVFTCLAVVAACAGLAGCAGLEPQQGATPFAHGNERMQDCMRYASESHCRDEIYGSGD